MQSLELKKQTLYNIREDHYELIQALEDADGELTPELEEALQLNEISFQEKAISYGYVVKGFENTEDAIDREIQRLSDLKTRSQKRQELFKTILSDAMQQFKIERIESPTLKLSFRKSETVEITDQTKIAAKFLEEKTTYVISKSKIKEAIKEGHTVNGAQLVIHQNLQIK